MASLGCFLKVLKLLKPLVDVVTGLTKLPPDAGKIASGMTELAPLPSRSPAASPPWPAGSPSSCATCC